jgi:hypothetical protein
MPRFQQADPPEFFVHATKLDTMLHHEAGHLVIAFYYGFDIGGFRYAYKNGELTGAVRNRPSAAVTALGAVTATKLETQKVLAGEIAGRIHCGLQPDRIVLMLDDPDPATITAQTPLDALHPSAAGQGHDTYKAVVLYRQRRIQANWWTWIWDCHDAAEQILHDNWARVEALAGRLATIPPYANAREEAAHTPSGAVNGRTLIDWCKEFDVPIHNPARVSVSY